MSESNPVPIAIREAFPLEYWVETSKEPGEKSGYVRRMSTEDFEQAMFFYRCINLGNGFKKRLRVHSRDFGVTKTLKKELS